MVLCVLLLTFLGVFAKLRNATIRFMSVHMELGSHWMDFHEILYFTIFQKTVGKIQVSLKLDKNKEDFTRRPTYIFDHISFHSL